MYGNEIEKVVESVVFKTMLHRTFSLNVLFCLNTPESTSNCISDATDTFRPRCCFFSLPLPTVQSHDLVAMTSHLWHAHIHSGGGNHLGPPHTPASLVFSHHLLTCCRAFNCMPRCDAGKVIHRGRFVFRGKKPGAFGSVI